MQMELSAAHAVELAQHFCHAYGGLMQVTIQEGRFVILSHERAEQAVAAHAMQLTTDLGITASELGDVSRLSSSLRLQNEDREVLQDIGGQVADKLGKLQSSVAAAATAPGKHAAGCAQDQASSTAGSLWLRLAVAPFAPASAMQ